MPSHQKRGVLRILIPALVLITGGVTAFFLLRLHHSTGADARFLPLFKSKKPNVVLFTVDTTRPDHLSAYGYSKVRTPSLDSLAEKGILFRECVSAAPLTLPSHSSIMTGTYPTYHGVRINGNTALSAENLTLAEAFSAQGYETSAFIGAFVLDGRWGLNQGFGHYDDRFDLKKYKKLDLGLVQRPANEIIDAAIAWLSPQKDKPFFAWLHLYDPHTPYSPPEPYRTEYGSRGIVGLYDGEIAFMDEQIGRFLVWLAENGLQEETIVAVIGDHGEGLGEHGEMTHGYFIYDYAVRVPFILSVPNKELSGIQIASQVRTIDLYPTLLQAAGIEIPKQVQGVSLWPMIGAGGGQDFFAYSESMTPSMQYGWSPLLSLRTADYKLIDAPRAEFYSLRDDPQEEKDIFGSKRQMAEDYEKKLKRIVAETSEGAPAASAANLDSETIERLAALGYIGAAVKTKSGASASALVDPKDRLDVHEAIQKAGELNNDDQYQESATVLEEILQKDPANPQARLLLASNYVELKRPEEATTLLESLLDEDPKNVRALVTLANIYQDHGKPDEAIRLCKSVLEVDDRNTQALAMLGQAYMEMKQFEEALPWLEKAVEIQPKMTQNQLNRAVCLIGLKRFEEGSEALQAIIAENPKFPMAYFHLGLLYEERGMFSEAVREYEKEIANYSNSFQARFNLGRLELRMGDHNAYMEQMRKVVSIAPKNPAGYLFLARGLLQERGDTNEILNLTEQGLSLARSSEYKAMGYFLLADVYTLKKQPQQVKQALAKANEYKLQMQTGNM
jgi:arylsulfatase A-like enzyme/Tfp pilus assembly protein PilF